MAYLIDVIGSAASAAYGLRQLRSAYAGSAVRVRRASDNAEQDIGFDGTGVLDWAAAIAFKGASTILVKTWYDQSGNAADLTQATTANQPALDTSTETVEFDGSNDNFQVALNLNASDKLSYFMLAESGTPGSFYIYVEHTAFLGDNDFALYADSSAIGRINSVRSAVENRDDVATFTTGVERLITVIIDRSLTGGNIVKSWVDSVAGADGLTSNIVGNFSNGTLYVGARGAASLFLNGSIREFTLFPIAIDATQRTNGEANLTSYIPGFLEVTTTTLDDGVEDIAYSETVVATGGAGAITWTIEDGELPPGLTLNASTGEISGTPASDGVYTFTIRATDEDDAFDEQDLSITITSSGAYETLNLTGMRLESVAWGGAILRASFGDGYGAKANIGTASGLHRWSLVAGGVWPDSTDMLTIEAVSRFEYYWEFFKEHTTGDTEIFVIEWRDKFYHASFVDAEISVDKFKNMLLYAGGVEVRQRRVVGASYDSDGAIETPDAPEGLIATPLSGSEIELEWDVVT